MGQESQSIAVRGKAPEASQLQLIDEERQVYLNIRNKRMYLMKNIIFGDLGDFQHELDIYKFRRINDNFVVSVDYCSNVSELEMCSNYTQLTYYIEKQEYTLFQKFIVPYQEGIKILLQVLQGFIILYQKFGYFKPNSKLIFFNHMQEPRVWINQDLKITKNIQYPNGPKNIVQQNTFIREIVHLFDFLRDPAMPMARYLEILPKKFINFHQAHNLILKKSIELSYQEPQIRVFNDIKNVKTEKIPLSEKSLMSCRPSPVSTPRLQSPLNFKKQVCPIMSFTYSSPQKMTNSHTPIKITDQYRDKDDLKQAARMSLKSTVVNARPGHCVQPSREFTSTMPNSFRNSSIFEKKIFIQKLDPTPTISDINSPKHLRRDENGIDQNNIRYSQDQHNINNNKLSFDSVPRKAKILKVSLDQQTKLMNLQNEKKSQKALYGNVIESSTSQKRSKNPSRPNINCVSSRRDFQQHKRHQTDFKMPYKMSISNDSVNQKSMIEGNYISKFNLNTIKSIHLLDEDRDLDRDIIVDLKQIINKYRKLA